MSIDSMPLNLQEARSLSRCASRLTPSDACSRVLTLTYPTAPWTTFPWSVRARMRAAAPLPPRSDALCPVTLLGSPPKPARDIRTHPPPDPAPPGARPAALALRPGGPQDRVVAAPAPASGAAPAGTLAHTSSADRPSSPQACTASRAFRASRPLRHGAASPAGAASNAPRRCAGGSRKRRGHHDSGDARDHESAAGWISPKAPLKLARRRIHRIHPIQRNGSRRTGYTRLGSRRIRIQPTRRRWSTIPPRCRHPSGSTPAPQMALSKGAAKAGSRTLAGKTR